MEGFEKFYDQWIADTITIISNKTSNSSEIILTNFNINDKSHLYVLEVAKVFAPFLGKKVSIDSESIGVIKYFLKSKIIGEVPRKKDAIVNGLVDVEEVIKEVMLSSLISDRGIFEIIYNDYYAPPTKKEIRKLRKQEKENNDI